VDAYYRKVFEEMRSDKDAKKKGTKPKRPGQGHEPVRSVMAQRRTLAVVGITTVRTL